MNQYVQYGGALCAPKEWINFDSSPTLRIQRNPVLNILLSKRLTFHFPEHVRYGDIVKGLPIKDDSCSGIYSSHVLEHLALDEFRIALKNTFRILKPGGTFRLVMPDLEQLVKSYLDQKKTGDKKASHMFMQESWLGMESRPKGLKARLASLFGNARHQWMWDSDSTLFELEKKDFKQIRSCQFNDSKDDMFKFVEDPERFKGAIAFEMTK